MAREALRHYLDQVGAQIRWRRARKPLLEELSDHIGDQARAYEAEGVPGPEALDRAVAGMGDPVEVGRELDRLHRPRTHWELVIVVAALVCAGGVVQTLAWPGDAAYLLGRHFTRALPGGVLFVLAWLSDYTRLLRRRATPWLVLGALAAGGRILHANWGILRPYCFWSPVYLDLLLPVAYAGVLCRLKGRGWFTVLLCALGALALPLSALMIPQLSAALVSAAAMLLVLGAAVRLGWFSCKTPLGLLCAWGPAAGLGGYCLSSVLDSSRWQVFLHPELDPLGGGWMYLQLRAENGPDWMSGDLWTHGDFMLADLSWQTDAGRWVYLLTALAFALFAALAVRRVGRLHSTAGKLIALSALWVLLLQAALFVAFNLGWSPVGPLSLPFLSHGGRFMAVNLLLAGVILSVLRMDALARDGLRQSPLPQLPEGTVTLPLPGGTLALTYRRRERGADLGGTPAEE